VHLGGNRAIVQATNYVATDKIIASTNCGMATMRRHRGGEAAGARGRVALARKKFG
jgi:methionine synthase II (cobalamin-independent)